MNSDFTQFHYQYYRKKIRKYFLLKLYSNILNEVQRQLEAFEKEVIFLPRGVCFLIKFPLKKIQK